MNVEVNLNADRCCECINIYLNILCEGVSDNNDISNADTTKIDNKYDSSNAFCCAIDMNIQPW